MSDVLQVGEATRVLVARRVVAYWELTKPRIAGMVLIARSMTTA